MTLYFRYEWYHNGRYLDLDNHKDDEFSRHESDPSTLVIRTRPKPSSSQGTYQCVLRNSAGTAMSRLSHLIEAGEANGNIGLPYWFARSTDLVSLIYPLWLNSEPGGECFEFCFLQYSQNLRVWIGGKWATRQLWRAARWCSNVITLTAFLKRLIHGSRLGAPRVAMTMCQLSWMRESPWMKKVWNESVNRWIAFGITQSGINSLLLSCRKPSHYSCNQRGRTRGAYV